MRKQRVKGIEHQRGLVELGAEGFVADVLSRSAQHSRGDPVLLALGQRVEQHIGDRAGSAGFEQRQLFAKLFKRYAHKHGARAAVYYVLGSRVRALKNVAAHSVKAEHFNMLAFCSAEYFKKRLFSLKGALVGNEHQHVLAAEYKLAHAVIYVGGLAGAALAENKP